MPKKTLFLLCDNYPLSSGEFFIDDEIKVLSPLFKKIIVFLPSQRERDLGRFMPKNLFVEEYPPIHIKFLDWLKNIGFLFSKMFLSELKSLPHSNRSYFTFFKIMFTDYIKAKKVKQIMLEYVKSNDIELENAAFYSYWHDYKALSLSMLRYQYPEVKLVARSHGWDNFRERHTPPYLPFKNYILENLSQTFSISQAGKKEFLKYGDFQNKITVSHLGKFNNRKALFNKEKKGFHFVSCSNIIELKRIHLIIDILSQLKNLENLRWTHFGDGNLRNKIEEYATKKLRHCQFEFKGIVENKEILDFYSENYIDLFINVSEHEGIPVSIMEAISAGIPVVATDVGGTREIVNDKTGFLINKDFSVVDVAKIMEDFISLPDSEQKKYRQNAHQFWEENYEATKNYTDFYNNLTNRL